MNREQVAAEDVRVGWLAKSRAGHDRGQVYVIVGKEKDGLYVADGRLKTVEHPKKKNPKHLQIIKLQAEEFLPEKRQAAFRNEEIKYALRQYHQKFL